MAKQDVIPHDTDLERALIGAILIYPQALDEIAVPVEAFYHARHRKIWQAILELRASSTVIDLLTVSDRLKAMGALDAVGGTAYLTKLVADTPSGVNAPAYAERVKELALRRATLSVMQKCAGRMIRDTKQPAALIATECIRDTEKAMERYVAFAKTEMARDGVDTALTWLDETIRRRNAGEPLSDAPMPFLPSLDRLFFPRRGNFVIVAARPKVGKTSFLLTWADYLAGVLGKKVAFVSLEMAAGELGERLLSMHSGVNGLKLRSGNVNQQEMAQLQKARADIAKMPLAIVDVPGLSVDNVPQVVYDVKKRLGGVDVVMVDYVGLLRGEGRSEYERVTHVSRELKRHARFLDVVMVAAHQFNRGASDRLRPLPELLKGSGALEQDVDGLIAVYRYPEDEEPQLGKGLKPRLIELMLNRAGVGEVRVDGALDTNRMRIVEVTSSATP